MSDSFSDQPDDPSPGQMSFVQFDFEDAGCVTRHEVDYITMSNCKLQLKTAAIQQLFVLRTVCLPGSPTAFSVHWRALSAAESS